MQDLTRKFCAVGVLAGLLIAGPVAAEEVDVEAAFEAGVAAYADGDLIAAMGHYEAAANAGSAAAQARLAWILDRSQDDELAVKWYRAAAAQGHADGYFGLGEMYAKGEGVDQDQGKAVENFTLAAEGGHAGAIAALVEAYENGGYGLEPDPAKAEFWRAAASASERSTDE